jgi:hypothetical protein
VNREQATLDALAGFLRGRNRRQRYVGPERIGAILTRAVRDLRRQAEQAEGREPQAPPPEAGEDNLAKAGGNRLTYKQAKV